MGRGVRLERGMGVVSFRDLRASRRDLEGRPSAGLGGRVLVPGALFGAVGMSIFISLHHIIISTAPDNRQ